jgi:NAD(P)H-hydrate epimerase
MAGAPALAALGALRAGAGLVRVAVPRGIQPAVAGFRPEATTLGLPEGRDGLLDRAATRVVLAEAEAWDAVVVGPGAGRSANASRVLRVLTSAMPRPLVLDADGLFAWNGRPKALAARAAETVLTPHAGEAARLLRTASREVEADRAAAARAIAEATGGVVVLKGPGTLVCDGERLWQDRSGGPVLASGGTGDLLAGMIGALLANARASGWDAFDAACAAVHVHSLAARFAARGADRGVLASDVADEVPQALATLVRRRRKAPS